MDGITEAAPRVRCNAAGGAVIAPSYAFRYGTALQREAGETL